MNSVDAPEVLPAGMSANTFSGLFQAIGGLRNRRAIVALLGCTAAGVLLGGVLVALSASLGFLFGFLAGLVYLLAIFTGINAAGLLQMDSARGLPPRSLVDALVAGLLCIPKLIVLGLALFAVEVGVFIILAILLLLCKIPFLGPLLFVVVFPLSVVVAGLTVCGVFLCGVLSLPAIWQGLTISRALTQTAAIARGRLVEAVLLLLFLGFLCFCVSLIVFGVLGAGLLPTMSMSAGMLGFGGMGGAAAMMMGGGGGIMVAGAIGGALLWAVAIALVGQVYLLGLSLVYLRVTDGLDLDATELALRASLEEARRRSSSLAAAASSAAAGAVASASGKDSDAAARPVAPPAPAPSFEAMRSAAFGGPPLPSAVAETTQPMAYRPADPSEFAPPPQTDIDLPFEDATGPAMIDLPFDDLPPAAELPSAVPPSSQTPPPPPSLPPPAAAPLPSYASPPAWMPPPAAAAPAPVPSAPPPITTCPQCLSAVTAGDVFCGVCGFRLK